MTYVLVITPTPPEISATQFSSASHSSAIKTASWSKYASSAALVAPLPQVPRVLPSVVLQHAERISRLTAVGEKKKKRSAAASSSTMEVAKAYPHATDLGLSGFIFSPEQDEQTQESSPTRMTRQQRKAAQAFTSLHSPIAAKSLGASERFRPGRGVQTGGDFDEERKRELALPESSTEPALFLFPTMTRQRQLHGKYVKLRFLGIFV